MNGSDSIRMKYRTRRRLAGLFIAMVLMGSTSVASAHFPSQGGDGWGTYSWTCNGGSPTTNGTCFNHHHSASARFHFEPSVSQAGFTAGLTAGYSVWDQTWSHQFNFIPEAVDSTSNANVRVVSYNICGTSTAVGCTGMGASGGHLTEGSTLIQFKSTLASNLVDDVGAHEFGHYLGLGHSDESYATMWGIATEGQNSLAYEDRVGRCMVYGHAHSYWGGCNHA